MFCKYCGKMVNDGSAFCVHCGASLTLSQPQAPIEPQIPMESQAPTQPQAPVEPQVPAEPQSVYQQPTQPYYQQPNFPNYQQPMNQNYGQPTYQNYQQPYTQPITPEQAVPTSVPWDMPWKDFYNAFVSKKSKSFITWMVVICFVTAALSAVLTFAFGGLMGLLDIGVYVVFGVLLLLTKHWLCALVPTLYSGFWTVLNLAGGGTPSGFVALVVGISCISVLLKADKAYKNYRNNHTLPTQQI